MMNDNLKMLDEFRRYVHAHVENVNEKHNYEFVGLCPFHNETRPSFTGNFEIGVYHCKSCDAKGHAYDFLKHFGCDMSKFKNGQINPNVVNQIQAQKHTNPPNIKLTNNHLLELKKAISDSNDINVKFPDKVANTYTEKALKELMIKYQHSNSRLVFPIFDEEGKVVQIYYHKPNPHFQKGIPFKAQLYPRHLIKGYNPNKPVFWVEGLKDVLMLRSWGLQGVSSTNGQAIPKDLSAIAHLKALIVIPDNDKPGYNFRDKVAEKLTTDLGKKVGVCDWNKMGIKYPDKTDISDISKDESQKLFLTTETYTPKSIGGFEEVDSTRIKTKDYKPISFAVENLLTTNKVNMLVGESGAGKSFFSLQLAMAIANRDEHFLGFKINVKDAHVLYVDTEVGGDEVLDRIDKINKNLTKDLYHHNWNIISCVERIDKAWEKIINAVDTYRPSILIVDCLYNTAKGVNTSKSNELDRILDYVNSIRRNYPNLTTLLVHHYNKGNTEQGLTLDRISGASNLIWNISGIATGIIKSGIADRYRLLQTLKVRGKIKTSCFLLNHNPDIDFIEMMGIEPNPTLHLKTKEKTKKLVKLSAEIGEELVKEDGYFQMSQVLNLQSRYSVTQSVMYSYVSQLEDMGLIQYVKNDGPSKIYKLGQIKFRKDDLFNEE